MPAACYGSTEAASVLLGTGAAVDGTNPDAHGWTPLMLASLQGSHRVLAVLLAAGSSVERTATQDNNATHLSDGCRYSTHVRACGSESRARCWVDM